MYVSPPPRKLKAVSEDVIFVVDMQPYGMESVYLSSHNTQNVLSWALKDGL